MTCKGICLQYLAQKLPHSPRYAMGQKRCQVCEQFINWDGLFCPCCNCKLRQNPRNKQYKGKMRNEVTVPKVKYVGSGEDPKLTPYIDIDYLHAVPRLNRHQFDALRDSI